jgi:hypothetical protein
MQSSTIPASHLGLSLLTSGNLEPIQYGWLLKMLYQNVHAFFPVVEGGLCELKKTCTFLG